MRRKVFIAWVIIALSAAAWMVLDRWIREFALLDRIGLSCSEMALPLQ